MVRKVSDQVFCVSTTARGEYSKIPHSLKFDAKVDKFGKMKKNYFLCTSVLKTLKNMEDITAKVKAIIVDKLGVDESEVQESASFTNDLGADSLDTVELIMEFEKVFGISISDDAAEKITTVGDAISYIEQNVE